jgi:hypothetical protein
MRLSACCIAMLSALTLSTAVTAQETPAAVAAPAVKAGAPLKSSDGKRVGRIERIVTAKNGAPVSASIIVDSRFVYVPYSTISASADGLVTSLSRAEVRKLN